ncbi:MAG: hypothetical protein WKF47_12550 [Geodermatophilaceae bacterium]
MLLAAVKQAFALSWGVALTRVPRSSSVPFRTRVRSTAAPPRVRGDRRRGDVLASLRVHQFGAPVWMGCGHLRAVLVEVVLLQRQRPVPFDDQQPDVSG